MRVRTSVILMEFWAAGPPKTPSKLRDFVVFLALVALSACVPGQVTSLAPSQTTGATTPPPTLATPFSQEPAAGICASFDGDMVEVVINADIPDPRCATVTPDQRLKIVNRTEGQIQIHLGNYDKTLEPGGDALFDLPFGEYLAPGVHLVQVTPCCGPELWLK